MRKAGGARAYIMQANGTVIPKQELGSNFDKKRLNPGDTIVVPERILKPTFLANFRDWTQILFQIGMTVATIVALNP